ncbi:MAG: hypothetical protein ABFE07_23505, partial [Armatimonadia bacterium]
SRGNGKGAEKLMDIDGKTAGKVLMIGASVEADLRKLLHVNRAHEGVELLGAIPVVVNPLLDRGAYLMSEPIRIRPPTLPLPVPCDDDRLVEFRYSMEWAMPKPRTFIGVDWGLEDAPRIRRRYRVRRCPARKRRMAQSKLDRRSNVRRSKRTRELERRRNRKEGKGS